MNLKASNKARGDIEDNPKPPLAPVNEQIKTPSPKPKRRRRLRGDASLESLAQSILEGKRVVFISGAGLSVASGVRPFRSGRPEDGSWLQPKTSSDDKRFAAASKTGLQAGLWDQVLWTTATREAFRQNPLKWYNEFWIPHLGSSGLGAKPNAGHHALQSILDEFPDSCSQITQNIDGLQSNNPHAKKISLIEIHGRAGLYKCLPDSDSDTDSDNDDDEDRPVHLGHRRKTRDLRKKLQDPTLCPYQYLESLDANQLLLPDRERSHLAPTNTNANSTHDSPSGKLKQLSEPPRCPACCNIAMPQALLFDEGYHSHSFYQFELAEDWLKDCEVLVFCGTSFAVNLTTVALDRARERKIPVYNFNLHDPLIATAWLNVSNIMGPAHETLPKLVETIQRIKYEAREDDATGSEAG